MLVEAQDERQKKQIMDLTYLEGRNISTAGVFRNIMMSSQSVSSESDI